jgi:hypothetical protein
VVVAVAVFCILAVLGLYLLGTAQRLDRLHARVDAAAAAFDAQLRRRCVVATGFSETAGLDAAGAARLREAVAAAHAVTGLGHDREVVESGVTRALIRAVAASRTDIAAPSGPAAELLDEALRASFARRFFNDAVRDALVVRDRRVVRWLRLAGHAPHPAYFEMDDEQLPAPRIPAATGRKA